MTQEIRNARSSVRVAFSTATLVTGPTGTSAVTLGALSSVAAGTMAPAVTGTSAVTLRPLTSSAAGTSAILPRVGTGASYLGRLTSTTTSGSQLLITGTSAARLGPLSIYSVGVAILRDVVFITPLECDMPWRDEPFLHWGPFCRGINVWLLEDGTFTVWQPANNEGVVKVYLGGHVNPIDAEERDALIAAGYGEYLQLAEVDS